MGASCLALFVALSGPAACASANEAQKARQPIVGQTTYSMPRVVYGLPYRPAPATHTSSRRR